MDLLACSASLSQPRFFERAANALAAAGADVECASDATVPLLRFQARRVPKKKGTEGKNLEDQILAYPCIYIYIYIHISWLKDVAVALGLQ